jgi:hypothetical protein
MNGETEGGAPAPESPEATPAEGPPEAQRAPLDREGMERPKFLLGYPEDPALERLITAFESGNYAYVRREADGVAKNASDPAVRDAAVELRRRIDPDPLAKYLLALAAALLVYLVIWAYRKSGAP